MTDGLRELADALQPVPGDPAPGVQLRQGVVTALAVGPPPTVTVRVGKATTAVAGVRYHSAYTPAVSDVVFLIQNGPDLLCLGTLATAVAAILSPTAAALAYVARASIVAGTVLTTESTTSTAYADLATPGPARTVVIGASGAALVIMTADVSCPASAGAYSIMSYAVSGATTLAGNDAQALVVQAAAATAQRVQASAIYMQTGLAAGNNTFTAKYRVTAGSGVFDSRTLVVIPL